MRLLLVPVAVVAVLPAAHAQETDEILARQLAAVVRDPREPLQVRIAATRAITRLGQRAAAAVPDLTAVVDRLRGTEQQPLQEAVVETLGAIGSPAKASVPALARAAGRSLDTDLAIRRSTDLILYAPDDQDVEALTRQLSARDAGLRMRAAKALGALGAAARSAGPALVTALNDTDADVRRAIVTALRLIEPNARPNEVVLRAMALDLKDPDPGMRYLAVRNLGLIGPPAAIVAAEVEALRNDPDPDVRRAAAAALGRLGAAP